VNALRRVHGNPSQILQRKRPMPPGPDHV
jgi:hypothetical protein